MLKLRWHFNYVIEPYPIGECVDMKVRGQHGGPLSFESWCKRRMLKGGSSELWILSGMRQQRSQEEKNSLRKRCLSILEYEKLEDWCLVTSFVNKKWEVSLIEGFLMA